MQGPDSPAPLLPNAPEVLKERIEDFLLGIQHPVLTEPGREMIDLSSSRYSLSTEYNKLLWHIWNENTNVIRQITAVQKERVGRMELRYQKFGKGPPGTLILAESRRGAERLERRSGRLRYLQALRRFLAQLFPEWKVDGLTSEPDLKRSFSGCYARGLLTRGQRAWTFIGAGEQEDSHTVDGILTYGLIWMDWMRRSDTGRVFEGLKIFVPSEKAATTLQRLAWMDMSVGQWEVYETGKEVYRSDPADVGNLKTALAPANRRSSSRASFENMIDRNIESINSLSPAIDLHFVSGSLRVLALRGLPFLKETAKGLVFGVGGSETLLEERNFGELQRLLTKLLHFRSAQSQQDSKSRLHPYYRLQPEKWMQSMLMRQSEILGYGLVPEAIYEQVPALSGSERGSMDLLAINSQGRLTVVELKASEDIHLPLQALDYWMRVHWHQKRGELEGHGYFPHRAISSQPPLLLLVSPALQFHPTCETILRYFSQSVEAVRIGLNENWRQGLQVMFRIPR